MLDRIEREPPHDIEAEQAFLGAILAKNSVLDGLRRFEPEDLYDPMHSAIFAAMRQQWETNKAVNVVTLRAHLATMPNITDDLNPVEYVRRLIGIGDASNVDSLANHLADLARRRRLCELGENLQTAARDHGTAVAEVAAVSTQLLNDVLAKSRGQKQTASRIGPAMHRFADKVQNGQTEDLITTGFQTLDDELGGWKRKQFAIIAGRPSMGKTTVATSSMLRTARAGHGVVCFSLEMPIDAMVARAISDLTYSHDRPVPYASAMNGRLVDWQKEKMWRGTFEFENLPVIIDDQRGLTISDITCRARNHAQAFEKEGKRLDLVLVDHLGLLKPTGRYSGNRVHEIAEISDGLSTLAKELDCAVVALSQLNRGTEGRENKRPTLADIRDSGSLEQDADVVLFTYREAYYLERNKAQPGSQEELERITNLEAYRHTLEILVAKQRNGSTASINMFCDMACNAIRDLAR